MMLIICQILKCPTADFVYWSCNVCKPCLSQVIIETEPNNKKCLVYRYLKCHSKYKMSGCHSHCCECGQYNRVQQTVDSYSYSTKYGDVKPQQRDGWRRPLSLSLSLLRLTIIDKFNGQVFLFNLYLAF